MSLRKRKSLADGQALHANEIGERTYFAVDIRDDSAETAGMLAEAFCSAAVCVRALRFSAFAAACGSAPAAARGTGGRESARATDAAPMAAAVRTAIVVASFISRLPSFR
jgi:hypothetical protein